MLNTYRNVFFSVKIAVCKVRPRDLGDGVCDDDANNPECNFDNGDCCLNTQASKQYCTQCLCKKEGKNKKSKHCYILQGDPTQTVKSNLPMTEWTKLLISHQKVILLSPRLGTSFYITVFIFDLQTMCKKWPISLLWDQVFYM